MEAKKEFPADHTRAARRLAGHANAALGSDIVWIVGLDEDAGSVTSPGVADLAEWWPKVRARFPNETVPRMTDVRVSTSEGDVLALGFETVESPYVVTTDGLKGVDREVPWREGTSVRTAHRRDLVRMLVPAVGVPQLDCLGGRVSLWSPRQVRPGEGAGVDLYRVNLAPTDTIFVLVSLTLFAHVLRPVFAPRHQTAGAIRAAGVESSPTQQLMSHRTPDYFDGRSIAYTPAGFAFNGPDTIEINTRADFPIAALGSLIDADELEVVLHFNLINSDRPATLAATLSHSGVVDERHLEGNHPGRSHLEVDGWKV